MTNTRIFNDNNIEKLDNLLKYLFDRKEVYMVSAEKQKDEMVFIVRW